MATLPGVTTEEQVPTYYSSDEEMVKEQEEEIDPFRHKIKMSKRQWAATYVLGAFLIPLRLITCLVLVLLSSIIARLTLIGLSDEDVQLKPITGWRRYGKSFAAIMGRLCFISCGFHSVKVYGAEQADPSVAPVLVAAPHSTYMDGFVTFWTHLPYLVSRVENMNIPLLGRCIALSQAIAVNREDPNSRQNTVKEIIRRTHLCESEDPDQRWPQLLIFPEGSCSNRKALMNFKPGAFIPGKPVQPVLVRYPNKIDTVTWTWNQPHGSKTVLFTTLAQLFSRASLELLPVYYPSDEERADPKLYASNVRTLMAKALEIPTNDLTFEEVKARYAKFYKKKNRSDSLKKHQ